MKNRLVTKYSARETNVPSEYAYVLYKLNVFTINSKSAEEVKRVGMTGVPEYGSSIPGRFRLLKPRPNIPADIIDRMLWPFSSHERLSLFNFAETPLLHWVESAIKYKWPKFLLAMLYIAGHLTLMNKQCRKCLEETANLVCKHCGMEMKETDRDIMGMMEKILKKRTNRLESPITKV